MLVVASAPVSIDFEFAGSQAETDIESVEQLWQPLPSKVVRRRKSRTAASGPNRDQFVSASHQRIQLAHPFSVGIDAAGVAPMKC